mmetsp:Transcript_15861/g.36720  ORF Transcript_15861/g.36720 Transcript_15861/m.36720 type:complete len:203 (-) Transcript_15861:1059-1667(-)
MLVRHGIADVVSVPEFLARIASVVLLHPGDVSHQKGLGRQAARAGTQEVQSVRFRHDLVDGAESRHPRRDQIPSDARFRIEEDGGRVADRQQRVLEGLGGLGIVLDVDLDQLDGVRRLRLSVDGEERGAQGHAADLVDRGLGERELDGEGGELVDQAVGLFLGARRPAAGVGIRGIVGGHRGGIGGHQIAVEVPLDGPGSTV